jgi:hypothetical protein
MNYAFIAGIWLDARWKGARVKSFMGRDNLRNLIWAYFSNKTVKVGNFMGSVAFTGC